MMNHQVIRNNSTKIAIERIIGRVVASASQTSGPLVENDKTKLRNPATCDTRGQ